VKSQLERNQEMKRIATALGVLAMVFPFATAQTETFTWTGYGYSTTWTDQANWSGPSMEYPGQDDTDDVVNITTTVYLFPDYSSGTMTVGTITLDADSTSVSLTVSGGTLTTTGLVTVQGDPDGAGTATLTVSGGTLQPNSFTVIGGANNSTTVTVTSGSIVTYTPEE
jgi:hypothetical protein